MDDFGAQGEWPVHPELLDWLAVEFMESGWNVKAMQKTIVMSATYRQSSRVTPELLQKDPDNRLLARGPRFRLGPEVIRDQALAVSGLLVEKVGGPSVKPYQPAGLWQELGRRLGLQAGQGRRALPAQPVHLLEAHRGAAVHDELRFAQSRAVHGVREPHQLAAAGAGPDERRHLSGGGAQAGGAHDDRGRRVRERAHRLRLSPGAGARARSGTAAGAARRRSTDFQRAIAATPARRASSSSRANRRCARSSTSAELAAYAGVASLMLNLDETITKE